MTLDHDPIFGKNVIETLSEGMYDNPLFLYREYVQNAADAIDAAERDGILKNGAGQIEVMVDKEKRLISFEDNGTGIPKDSVKSMLANIGDSQKDRKIDKGFRGIGRLGGLGYCQKVRFETSFKGEKVKSIFEWDAKNLHEILADPAEKIHAGQLIRRITSTWEEKCEKDIHFFRVLLININPSCDELLDVEEVRRYLSMVAPVPFDYSKFPFVEKIEQFMREEDLPSLSEYRLHLNTEEVRKGYSSPLEIEGSKSIEFLDVVCRTLRDDSGKMVGWLWFGVSLFDGVLSKKCWQRALRLRKANIQIGESDCLANPRREQKLWREDRGNNYFLGEVHALDESLIPNSRRDYFNPDNSCRYFEQILKVEFQELHKLYHDASEVRSSFKTIHEAENAQKDFEEKDKIGFYNQDERNKACEKLEIIQKKRVKAEKKLDKITEELTDPNIDYKPTMHILNKYSEKLKTKPIVLPPKKPCKKYTEQNIKQSVRDVLEKVFEVLYKMLPEEEANPIKNEIAKRFQRK